MVNVRFWPVTVSQPNRFRVRYWVNTGRARSWLARPSLTHSGHSASDYSITSSAVARIVCGMVRLSALAVLRLITISNFVGC